MTQLTRILAAAGAGLLVTVGFLFTPMATALPPLVLPYVGLDARFLLAPVSFAAMQTVGERFAWPAPATTMPAATVMASIPANLHASQVLAFLGVPWARGGMEVDLLAMAPVLLAVLVGLWIAFDAAGERTRGQLLERGLTEQEADRGHQVGRALGWEALALSALASAGLALLARLLALVLGGVALPVPELFTIALVLLAGGLWLGVDRAREDAPGR